MVRSGQTYRFKQQFKGCTEQNVSNHPTYFHSTPGVEERQRSYSTYQQQSNFANTVRTSMEDTCKVRPKNGDAGSTDKLYQL